MNRRCVIPASSYVTETREGPPPTTVTCRFVPSIMACTTVPLMAAMLYGSGPRFLRVGSVVLLASVVSTVVTRVEETGLVTGARGLAAVLTGAQSVVAAVND